MPAKRPLEGAVQQAEQRLPFFAQQAISKAPPDQVKAFLTMAAKAVVDAALLQK
jgi:hypothetical protein